MKKKFLVIVLAMIVGATSIVMANGIKGFSPYMIPVDKDNLPSEVSMEDLEGDFVSAHKIEEIALREGKDILIEGTDGNLYVGKPNMVIHSKIEEVAVEEEPVEETTIVAEVPTENIAPQPTEQPAPQPTEQPSHEHKWKTVAAQYETKHHEAQYQDIWVEDKPAWSEEVLVKEAWQEEEIYEEWQERTVYTSCTGFKTYSKEEIVAWMNSVTLEELMAGACNNYSTAAEYYPVQMSRIIYHDAEYQTVWHEAEGHYEKQLVKEAYDEKVLVSGGYEICETCGATR